MSFTVAILEWFRENGRVLPWRETRDPYAIWLSEIILQQTRIEQGKPYWERFMKRWPTVEAMAVPPCVSRWVDSRFNADAAVLKPVSRHSYEEP